MNGTASPSHATRTNAPCHEQVRNWAGRMGIKVPLQRPSSRKAAAMIRVGQSAPKNKRPAETPSGKNFERIDWPAGLGALAMTVKSSTHDRSGDDGVFEFVAESGTREPDK